MSTVIVMFLFLDQKNVSRAIIFFLLKKCLKDNKDYISLL